jgi:hypothetical protein
MTMRTRRRLLGLVAAVALAGALAGCGTGAPWFGQSVTEPTPHDTAATPTPERTFGTGFGTGTASAETSEPVVNDLAQGSLERQFAAGPLTVDVTYWSELSMDRWTADALKPLSFSLTAAVTPDDGQGVYLQSVRMSVAPDAGDAPDDQTDIANQEHGYVVATPYSYSQTFTIGPAPAAATAMTVQLRYEFLVETTPTSGEFAKHTATDTLTVALAG